MRNGSVISKSMVAAQHCEWVLYYVKSRQPVGEQWATHCGVAIVPARLHANRQKQGKVQHRAFFSLSKLNSEIPMLVEQ